MASRPPMHRVGAQHAAPLTQRAVLELGIDVPVMRADAGPAGTVTLYLYGGRIVVWEPAQGDSPSAPPLLRSPAPPPPAPSGEGAPAAEAAAPAPAQKRPSRKKGV